MRATMLAKSGVPKKRFILCGAVLLQPLQLCKTELLHEKYRHLQPNQDFDQLTIRPSRRDVCFSLPRVLSRSHVARPVRELLRRCRKSSENRRAAFRKQKTGVR